MLNIDAFYLLSTLIYLREHPSAKEVAATILNLADKSELQTIKRCADILETNALPVAMAKLDWYASQLDEHHSALVQFCKDNTGDRLRRADTDTPEQPAGLSVFSDSRPGYHNHDAQPSGLDAPSPWEIQRANRWAQLSRQLRDHRTQLPAHVRTALRDIRNPSKPDTPPPGDLLALNTNPEARQVYDAYRRRGTSHTLAFTLATTTEQQRNAITQAKQLTDDYIRTRLGVEDRTAPRGTEPTVFDVEDQIAVNTRYRKIHCDLCSHVRNAEDTPARWDDGLCRECRHVTTTFRATPCVYCWIERSYADHRGTARRLGHATGHDDGLCGECRDKGRTGLPRTEPTVRRAIRSVAYLHTEDRAATARAAAITALCAAVADYLPPAAALAWLYRYFLLASENDRPIIKQWAAQWRATRQPQPPTPAAPAAARTAPVPALAAA